MPGIFLLLLFLFCVWGEFQEPIKLKSIEAKTIYIDRVREVEKPVIQVVEKPVQKVITKTVIEERIADKPVERIVIANKPPVNEHKSKFMIDCRRSMFTHEECEKIWKNDEQD